MEDFLEYYENKYKKTKLKAITFLKVLKTNNNYSLIELNPQTGRKHQLRKQLYLKRFPNNWRSKNTITIKTKKSKSSFMLLHSYKLRFMKNEKKFSYIAELDRDFKKMEFIF